MKIDQSHRPWFLVSIVILAVGAAAYIPYALLYPGGPRGNSLPGLIYGVVGYAMMLFAGLLGARKKVPLWRVGSAKVWMRGHLWLGALSLPVILFHAGFTARGPLSFVLLVLLVTVVLSGIAGALIQHFVPRRMTSSVQLETIYEQIPHVREQLLAEAAAIVDRLCEDAPAVSHATTAFETGRTVLTADDDDPPQALSDADRARLRQVYTDVIAPFLRDPERGSQLGNSVKAPLFFEALRRQSPDSILPELRDLEHICDEERQLTKQRRMYLVLHAWLLVHVPLSITLLVLGGIHALVAIRY